MVRARNRNKQINDVQQASDLIFYLRSKQNCSCALQISKVQKNEVLQFWGGSELDSAMELYQKKIKS